MSHGNESSRERRFLGTKVPWYESSSYPNFIALIIAVDCLTVEQAYGVVIFLFNYAIPFVVYAFCYGSIFHTIRRQSRIVAAHAGRNQNIVTATTSRDANTGQAAAHGARATTGAPSLSRTEMNILKTLIPIIICHLLAFSFYSIPEFLEVLEVSNYR